MNHIEAITPNHWPEVIPTEPLAIAAYALALILFIVGAAIIRQARRNARVKRELSHRLTVDFVTYKQREGEGILK